MADLGSTKVFGDLTVAGDIRIGGASVIDTINAGDNTAVKLTGDQTIAGVKTFSSTISGNITGNAGTASTATKLQTARTISLSGDSTGSVTFDGSANANIVVTRSTANMLSDILAVDGAGSGIDADLLDGQHGSYYGTAAAVALNTAKVSNVSTNLSYTTAATTGTVVSSDGTNATIPAATTALAGLMTNVDKTKLDGIAAGAQVNVATNLSVTAGTTAGPIVTSSTGTNATLPTASATASGVVTTGAQTIAGVKTFSSAITGNITGNADTATKLSTTRANFKGITDSVVVGELMWKNFGNSHTIFDASNSTTPTGVAKNNTNPEIAWSATYPTLMGYNGNQTYGVRVDSSRYADQLKTARTINGVSFDGSANITISDSTKVALTGNETIAGIKTFSSSPVVPTPTDTTQAANKAYVDSTTSTALPKGFIGMWSGSIATIPTGWVLCDGLNNTPNLVDRFVVGAGSTYAVGATGGSADAVVVSHSHTASTDSQGNHIHGAWTDGQGNHAHTTQGHVSANRFSYGGGGGTAGIGIPYSAAAETSVAGHHGHNVGIGEAGAHGHNIAVSTNGESGTNKNLPPYYALCYIMKT